MGRKKTVTIAERLKSDPPPLTDAERKLAHALFADYPMAGLGSISDFARAAGVSTPSVLRFAKKLGFAGFPAMQEALRQELSAQLQDPIARHDRWSAEAPDAHILNRFANAAMENLRSSIRLVGPRVFDDTAALVGNQRHALHIMGGRITHSLAAYLHTHLSMARPGVRLISPVTAQWPVHLLEIAKGDVLVVFDVRRYDARMLDFAASAREAGARIVLITDQWISPIARIAMHTLPLRIEVPSSWDSNIVPLFMAECLVAAVVNRDWPATQSRLHDLEKLTDGMRRSR
jgi:DNA-binding MurR/RpiR family transcriptional regulator